MGFDIKEISELANIEIDKSEEKELVKDMQEIIKFIENYGKGNY